MNLVDKSRKKKFFCCSYKLGWSQNDRVTRRRRLQEGVATESLGRRYHLSQICKQGHMESPRNPVLPCTCYCTCHHVLLQHPCWARTLHTTAGAHTKLSLPSGCRGCCDLHHPPPHTVFSASSLAPCTNSVPLKPSPSPMYWPRVHERLESQHLTFLPALVGGELGLLHHLWGRGCLLDKSRA